MKHIVIVLLLFTTLFAGNPYDTLFLRNAELLDEFLGYVNDSASVRRTTQIDLNTPNPYKHSDRRLDYIEQVIYRLGMFKAQKYLLKYRVPAPPNKSTPYELPLAQPYESEKIPLRLRLFKDTTTRYILFEELAYILSGVDDFPDLGYFKDKIAHDNYLTLIYEQGHYFKDSLDYKLFDLAYKIKKPLTGMTDSLVLVQLAQLRSLPRKQQLALVFPVIKHDHRRTRYQRALQKHLVEKRFHFTRDGYGKPSYVYLPTPKDKELFMHPDILWYFSNLLKSYQRSKTSNATKIERLLSYREQLLSEREE